MLNGYKNINMKYTEEEINILKRKYALSQSAIKQLIDRQGNEIPFCPMKFAKTYITKTDKLPDKEVFKQGRYFEQLAIGGSSSHSAGESNELERKVPNKKQKALGLKGDKKISQIRIETQAEKFKELAKEKGLEYNEKNTQVVIYKRLGIAKDIKDDVLFRGEIDWGPLPTNTVSFGDTITLIDIKLTGNLNNEFGDYSWKNHQYVNKIQAYSYLNMLQDIDFELNDLLNPGNNIREALAFCGYQLVKKQDPEIAKSLDIDNLSKDEQELLIDMVQGLIDKEYINFVYWIFDYAPDMQNLLVPVEIDKTTKLLLKETLRKSISIVRDIVDYYNANGEFKTNFNPNVCQGCHIKECPERDNNEYLF